MKKLSLLAAAFGLVVAANAQAPFGLPISGLGYDVTMDMDQISARVPLGGNSNLDAGIALEFDNSLDSAQFGFGVSAIYLHNLHNWGPVSSHLAVGGLLAKPMGTTPVPDPDIMIQAVAGIQPEVLLLEHILLSTRFGFTVDLQPELVLATTGQDVSIVTGASFKIMF